MRLVAMSVLSAGAALLAACASVPAVTANYFLPKAETALTVTQTLGCTPDKQNLVIATSVGAPTAYKADLSQKRSLDFAALGGALVDADTAIVFTADGRLSAINASATGEGGQIVKAAVNLGTAVAASGLVASTSGGRGPASGAPPRDLTAACNAIDQYAAQPKGGSGGGSAQAQSKVLTLVFVQSLDYATADCGGTTGDTILPAGCIRAASQEGEEADRMTAAVGPAEAKPAARFALVPAPDSRGAYDALAGQPALRASLQPQVAVFASAAVPQPLAADDGTTASQPALVLPRLALVHFVVTGLSDRWADATALARATLWDGDARIPLSGATYLVPLPAPQLFGKSQFAFAQADDGSIAKLEYGKTSGTADALGALAAIAQSQQAQTAAQQASATQAQSDLIYQQQRLVACQSSPKTCPAK